MNNKRFITLDIAKALMIILVVIGHYNPIDAPNWYHLILKFIYTFHMPVFLFVSGYVYIATKRKESYFSFLYKKVKRLLVPYYVTSAIVISIKLLTQGNMHVKNPVSVDAYFEMFCLPVAGYFLWFVLALWWMFVIVPWFKTKTQRLILFAISAVLAFIPIELTDVMCINELKKMFVYFMCGIAIYDYKDKINKVVTQLSRSITIPTLFILMEVLYFMYNIKWIEYILPFMGIAFVIQFSNILCSIAKGKIMKALLYCSSTSYIIYLFHTTFEGFAKSVLMKFYEILPTNDCIFVLGALLITIIGIVGPLIIYEVIKRNSITRFLFGLKS